MGSHKDMARAAWPATAVCIDSSETDFYEKMDEALRALDEFYRDMDLFEEEQAILDFMGEEPGWVAQLSGPERAARREASVKLPRCGE